MIDNLINAAIKLRTTIDREVISPLKQRSGGGGSIEGIAAASSSPTRETLPTLEINKIVDEINTFQTTLSTYANKRTGTPTSLTRPPERGSSTDSATKITLSQFFSNVGNSVIEAQDILDRTVSDRQIQGHTNPIRDTIPRAMYRIPKVSAEVNLGFDLSESKKVNMFVFGKEHSEKESMQQKVSFEIVSIPAPIELIDETAERRVILDRLASGTDSDDKRTIRDGLGAAFVRRGPESWLVALGTAAPPSVILALIPYASTQEIICKRIGSDSAELLGAWLMPLASQGRERFGS